MAVTTISLTDEWQLLGNGPCVVSIKRMQSQEIISLNEAEDDDTSRQWTVKGDEQFLQNEAKPVYAKGARITVTIDTAG